MSGLLTLAGDSQLMKTTLDQKIAEFFNNNFNLGGDWPWGNFILCCIAILLSVLLCGVIGFEREKRGRSAGLRTHLLVGVGSCVVMIISIYGFPAEDGRDVARLAAGVITGVGFLGAGAIIHNNGGIKGLTTASTIWLVMAIGIACGSMNFIIAIASTLVVMTVLVLFRKLEQKVSRSSPLFVVLVDSHVPVLTDLLNVAGRFDYTISDVVSSMTRDSDQSLIEITFKVMEANGKNVDITEFVNELGKVDGIKNINVLNHH